MSKDIRTFCLTDSLVIICYLISLEEVLRFLPLPDVGFMPMFWIKKKKKKRTNLWHNWH